MSEYVKIERRLYDELVETKAKYAVLCEMIEALKKVYEENRPNGDARCGEEKRDEERLDATEQG